MSSTVDWRDYVVHLPLPNAFGDSEAQARASMLKHVRYLLVAGSLMRPRRFVQHACSNLGLDHIGTYFSIFDDAAVVDREFNIEVIDLGIGAGASGSSGSGTNVTGEPQPVHVAVASHGIGGSGVEIVLGELCALVRIAREMLGMKEPYAICGVGRSGTRATLGQHAYGTVGISTASFNPDFDVSMPDPTLLNCLVDAARESERPWALGEGIATDFFWSGQGRVLPHQGEIADALVTRREAAAQEMLWSWVERGIDFIEMEDHALHAIARRIGVPSVSAGAIIARRFDPQRGRFVLDYDAEAKHRSELWPAELLLDAFRRHWRGLAERGGPETLLEPDAV